MIKMIRQRKGGLGSDRLLLGGDKERLGRG